MKDPDVPEEDAVEQEESGEERPRDVKIPPDVPEADALDQATPGPRDVKIPPDVPEADALDQATPVPLDEEEEERR